MFNSKTLISFLLCAFLSLGIALGIKTVYSRFLDWQAERISHYQPLLENKKLDWTGPEIGEKIDLTKFQDSEGKTFGENLKNNRVLIIRIHPDCGMCRLSTDQMQKVINQAETNSFDVGIVSLNSNVPISRVKEFTEFANLNAKYYSWAGDEVETSPSLMKMVNPSFILVDNQGTILKKFPGSNVDARIRRAMTNEVISGLKEEKEKLSQPK
ncbi:MAG TPA: hypothetical protein VK308_12005 [Pyrinomonadaceae bacterium]|nr:hypothetical protein [Pyrinomonadaceae bacterium]